MEVNRSVTDQSFPRVRRLCSCLPLSECRGTHYTITVIYCSYFNHKAMDHTSMDTSAKLCANVRKQKNKAGIPPEKGFSN